MFDAGSVVARIKADLSDFQAGLKKTQDMAKTFGDKVSGGIKDITPSLQKASVAFGAVGAVGTLVLKDWISAASGAQVSMAKFETTLANIWGDNWDSEAEAARQAFLDASAAVVQLGFDDEDAAISMANLYQRTGDATKAIELNALAMDLARTKNIDLASASTLVGQVLSGNGKVLKQYGIDIKETASPLEALAQLQTVVGGQADSFASTLAGKMEIMNNRIGNFKESLGTALLPIMEQFLEVGLRIMDWFESLSPATVDIIAKVVLFGTAASLVIAPLLIMVTMIPALISGFTALGGVLAFVFSPITLLTVGIAALYAAWSFNLFGIQEKTATFFQSVSDLLALFKFVWENDWFYIQTIVTVFTGFIYDHFVVFWETLKMLFSVALLLLQGNWSGAWDAMKVWAKVVFDIVMKWSSGFWDGLSSIFKAGGELVGGLWNGFMDGIKNVTLSVWEGVKKMFVDSINWIIGKMNAFLSALDGVSGVLGKALGLGKKGLSIGNIPMLAQGGIVDRPTLAMIGEGGEPEAVIPLSKLGDMAGGGWHIHIDGAIIGSVDSAVDVLDMAMRRLRPSLGV